MTQEEEISPHAPRLSAQANAIDTSQMPSLGGIYAPLALLNSDDPRTRDMGRRQLASFVKEEYHADSLIKALDIRVTNEDWVALSPITKLLSGYIIETIEPSDVQYAEQVLLKVLKSPQPEVSASTLRGKKSFISRSYNDSRINAIEAIWKLTDENSLPHIISRLEDGNHRVRNKAISIISQAPKESVVPPLIDLLESPRKQTTIAVSVALGFHGQPEAIQGLLETYSQSEEYQHSMIMYILSKRIGPRALPIILTNIRELDLSDLSYDSEWQASFLIEALGEIFNKIPITDRKDVPELNDAITLLNQCLLAGDIDYHSRMSSNAAEALAKIGYWDQQTLINLHQKLTHLTFAYDLYGYLLLLEKLGNRVRPLLERLLSQSNFRGESRHRFHELLEQLDS